MEKVATERSCRAVVVLGTVGGVGAHHGGMGLAETVYVS